MYGLCEYETVARLTAKEAEALERIVTHRFDSNRAEEAFRAAEEASEGKVVID